MIEYKIRVENEAVGNALGIFFTNYTDQVAAFLTNVLKSETGSADVSIVTKTDDDVIEVWQFAPDKGKVLGQVDGAVVLTDYTSLPNDAKYITYNGQHLVLYLKQPEGESDISVGRFLTLNEAVNQIDSESVKDQIQTIKNAINNAEVERKAVMKKAAKLKKQAMKND